MARGVLALRLFSEILAPRDADLSSAAIEAKALIAAGAQALFVPDAPGGVARVDAVMCAVLLQRELGVPCIPHLNCRDRNRVALRGALLAARAAGLSCVKVVTGDPLPGSGVTGVWDEDSISLARMASDIGLEVVIGHRLSGPGSASSVDRLQDKVRAGARMAMTTPLLDPAAARDVVAVCKAAGVKPLISLVSIPSIEVLRHFEQELRAFQAAPHAAIRLRDAVDPVQEGVSLAMEVAEAVGNDAAFVVALPFGRAQAGIPLLRELRGSVLHPRGGVA
jgi:homocysteine S-methyltransferase